MTLTPHQTHQKLSATFCIKLIVTESCASKMASYILGQPLLPTFETGSKLFIFVSQESL